MVPSRCSPKQGGPVAAGETGGSLVSSARSPLTSQPVKCPSHAAGQVLESRFTASGSANTHGEGSFFVFFFYCQGIRVRGNFSCSPGDTCEEEVGQEQAERRVTPGHLCARRTTSPSFPIHGGEDSALWEGRSLSFLGPLD